MGLLPEWPWRARRYRISCPDESVQILKFFSCCLRLLPFCSSTFQQTNVEIAQNRSEDNLIISRIQSLHLSRGKWPWRRRVLSCFGHWVSEIRDWGPGSIQVHILSQIGTVLVDEQAEVRLRGFALAFDRLAKASTFFFNAKSSNCISEVSCSLSSYSLSIKSVTNLFNPWEILTHEWEVSLFTDSILIPTPYLPCR